jgi:hypothetical protein
VNSAGGEHFGFAVTKQATAARFYWLDKRLDGLHRRIGPPRSQLQRRLGHRFFRRALGESRSKLSRLKSIGRIANAATITTLRRGDYPNGFHQREAGSIPGLRRFSAPEFSAGIAGTVQSPIAEW